RPVSFTPEPTQPMPSMSRMASSPTTPLPRAGGRPQPGVPPTMAGEPARRSVLSALLLWLVIVGAVFGGGGFYAYKKGLIFAARANPPADTTAKAAATTIPRATATPPSSAAGVGAVDTRRTAL